VAYGVFALLTSRPYVPGTIVAGLAIIRLFGHRAAFTPPQYPQQPYPPQPYGQQQYPPQPYAPPQYPPPQQFPAPPSS
jgi:hypothetical protein